MKYLFGPVNSRRLGISLGVDLTPHKTCSFDCIYCECGPTTNLTLERKEYVPLKEVIQELDEYLSSSPELNFITFSGGGEPTLHSGIGHIIKHLKENYPDYKVAVLTNGSTMIMDDVLKELLPADLVIPSLDGISDHVVEKILRPIGGFDIQRVVDSLVRFRSLFKGKIILEIFFAQGINDSKEEITKLKEACIKIKPDAIQLNSLDRPGAVDWIQPIDSERMNEIREFFKPLVVQVIGRPKYDEILTIERSNISEEILAIVKRRPSTIDDLCLTLGVQKTELWKVISFMKEKGILSEIKEERGVFYRPDSNQRG